MAHEHYLSESKMNLKKFWPSIISFILLSVGIVADKLALPIFNTPIVKFLWFTIAYFPVAFPVIKGAFEEMRHKEFFNEFTLMLIATIGAFYIGEYPEAVAVMLFYSIGEIFQESAVSKAQQNIKDLLDIRSLFANVLRGGIYRQVAPQMVEIGETIQVKAGEKVPLDSILLSPQSSYNTAALTGESKPMTIREGERVLAGMVNLDKVVEMRVEKTYSDSSLAKILQMVQNATSRKAKTELLIRRFARIYTPVVFLLAIVITLLPYFFVPNYEFDSWLYRALVFLVISCPCALVISVPLGYFGGIGAASRNGILFKGANYLDLITKVNTIVMDKTGTLTEGVFEVQKINCEYTNNDKFINIVASIEKSSNHPVAKAIVNYASMKNISIEDATDVEEISGHGMKGKVDNASVLVGNNKLMQKYNVTYDSSIDSIAETTIIVAIDNKYAGHIIIADRIKKDAKETIIGLHKLGIKTMMLSGDKSTIVNKVAAKIGIDDAYGSLLPEDKVKHIEELKKNKTNIVAFVGDGINDSPALALSDVGIAMGGMGSDAAIEVADVVIQTDQPHKIVMAIRIAKSTQTIVIQNIVFALLVKAIIMILGALGIASMWEAVFADVGVSLLAILNSIRILKKKF